MKSSPSKNDIIRNISPVPPLLTALGQSSPKKEGAGKATRVNTMLLQCRYFVSCERGCRRRLRPAGELPQHWEVSLVGADASQLRYAADILLSVRVPPCFISN
ncbi:hypothetical protein NDU88_001602 [Pleurodeles waltl]|uniref:Uncharacterized protein n=1 Tax=Pleurodeles waltl TaxID=8319 RepID=A0AAV7UUT2_PLEWA|nr:hypothetical protein NDU88_001602 [Pleurodeles waltl]